MDNDRSALSSAKPLGVGHEVMWYTIESVLGRGGFGITYLAHDRNLDRQVAIKEYLPVTFAYRHDDHSVKPLTGQHEGDFGWGLQSFLNEAQTLAKFSHPNIVRVHSVFEANSTAYMVMEYEHGDNLAALYKRRRGLPQRELEDVFLPILDGLGAIHRFGFIHRDIKPANIYLRGDGTPVLIDFGSARQTSQQETGEMTTLVSHGYTPLEQYSSSYGEQGPWTDVYAIAATLYEGVTGERPDPALNRAACRMRNRPDLVAPLESADRPGFTPEFLDAIGAGLRLEPEERPQDLESWAAMLEPAAAPGDDRTVLQPDPFDALHDDDRTRLQPARAEPAAFESFEPSTTSTRAGSRTEAPRADASTSVRRRTAPPATASRRAPGGGPDIDFDIDPADLEGVTSIGARGAGGASARSDGRKKGIGVAGKLVGAAVLAGAAALGAWWFLPSVLAPTATDGPSVQAPDDRLDELPRPLEPVAVELPSEREARRLDTLLELANAYAEAHAIDPGDPRVADGTREIHDRLERSAASWNAARHPAIAERIARIARALPVDAARGGAILRLLDEGGPSVASADVVALLDEGRIVEPEGEAVIDRVGALDAEGFASLGAEPGWLELISELNERTVARMRDGDFDTAARLVEATLALAPDDPTSARLRAHLGTR